MASRKSGFVTVIQTVIWVVAISLGLMFIIMIYNGLFVGEKPWLLDVAKCQFPVFVGLPIGGLCSSFVVLVFKTLTDGEIILKIGNILEVQGPTAPIILWIVCFAVISTCIKTLWNYNLSIPGCS